MNYSIALNFEDGVTRFIDVAAHELLADAAYRQGVNIPLDCRDGACGTCKCKVESGQYDLGDDYIDEALSEEEAEQGFALSCQLRAESHCVISIPASSEVCKIAAASFNAEVTEIKPLSASTFLLRLRSPEFETLKFLSGQYINVGVPNSTETRSYSFACLVDDSQSIELLIKNVPDGLMSEYLANHCQVGDQLTLTGPFGSFYLRDNDRPVLMLAGGTGLAPFLAMLDQYQQQQLTQPTHLVYGVSADEDLVHLERLEHYAAALSNFSYTTCVANELTSHPRSGYVTEHLNTDLWKSHGEFDAYLCGPPAMVDAVQQFFTAQSLAPANFHYEKFNPAAIPA